MKSIYEFLQEYTKGEMYPFHMPGHKRNRDFLSYALDPVSIDITEVFGGDNLQDPSGIIYDAQVKSADLFGADQSFLLANGSTGGIIAAILSAVKNGGNIIMSRNSHMSAYSALTFGNLRPIYVYPDITELGIAASISPESVREAFKKAPYARAVFITSPTYEGVISDIKTIAEIAHENNAVLIVDEAHGSHMAFHGAFPKSALGQGADIVINSLHKTLPSLTQTALLHTKGDRCNHRLIRQFLNMVNSSSPSYILLSSIGKCLDFLTDSESAFNKYADNLEALRSNINNLSNLKLLGKNNLENVFDSDISKIVIAADDGNGLELALRQRYNLQMEMNSDNIVLAMTSVADTIQGFNRLRDALKDLDKIYKKVDKKPFAEYPKPVAVMSLTSAIYSSTKKKPLKDASGEIAAENIAPYPPGLPICIPGEIISKEVLEFLPQSYAQRDVRIVNQDI